MAELQKLKLVELKALCKEKGLPVSGTKTELIERITASDTKTTTEPKPKKQPKKQQPKNILTKPVFTHLETHRQPIVIQRNIHGNFEHLETKLVFNPSKKVYGVQTEDGMIRALSFGDLENIHKYHFEMDEDARVTGTAQDTQTQLEQIQEQQEQQRLEELYSAI